jgi:hypothetical protein
LIDVLLMGSRGNSPHVGAYAAEMAWKEDNRRQSNGALHAAATGVALGHPVSRTWAGYWQNYHSA